MEYLLLKIDLLIKFRKHEQVDEIWQRVEHLFEENKENWLSRDKSEEARKFADGFGYYKNSYSTWLSSLSDEALKHFR